MTETPPPVGTETHTQQPPARPPTNGMAIAGMVLGIVAIVLFCVWYIGLPCAVVGLVLSALGLRRAKESGTGKGMATAGLVLCVIALGIDVLGIFLAAWFLALLGWGAAAAGSAAA